MTLQQCSGDIRDELMHSDVKSFREAIYRTRQKTIPHITNTLDEACDQLFTNQGSIMYKDEQFCFVNDEKTEIIFTCRENLEMLCQSEFVFGGGTLSYAPCHFS